MIYYVLYWIYMSYSRIPFDAPAAIRNQEIRKSTKQTLIQIIYAVA